MLFPKFRLMVIIWKLFFNLLFAVLIFIIFTLLSCKKYETFSRSAEIIVYSFIILYILQLFYFICFYKLFVMFSYLFSKKCDFLQDPSCWNVYSLGNSYFSCLYFILLVCSPITVYYAAMCDVALTFVDTFIWFLFLNARI